MAEKILEGKKIAFVSGDLGGCGDALPVVKKIEELGAEIIFFADPEGESRKKLEKIGVPSYDTRGPDLDKDQDLSGIIIGVSATAWKLQADWTKFGSDYGYPVFWIEDMWGTAGVSDVRKALAADPEKSYPNAIFVMDDVARDLNADFYSESAIHVCGKTTFEGLYSIREKKGEVRQAVRDRTGIRGVGCNDFVITYWSGGTSLDRVENQLEVIMSSIIAVFKKVDKPIAFAPRFHPKLSRFGENVLDDLWKKVWKMWSKKETSSAAMYIVDFRGESPEDVICASDITIGDWGGNENLRSTVLGVPAIITLFPDDTKARLKRGYPKGIPPLVHAGAAYGPGNMSELTESIVSIIRRDGVYHGMNAAALPYKEMGIPGATQKIVDWIIETMAEYGN